MDHVGVMSDDPAFRWLDRVILDLHYDACYFQKESDPGQYRRRANRGDEPAWRSAALRRAAHENVPELMK